MPETTNPVADLIDFGVKKIKEVGQAVIDGFTFLLHPAEGSVAFLNDTEEGIKAETYDQNDAVRWVSYETRRIAPHQAVELAARGETIHIKIGGYMFDCTKGTAYLYDGQNVHPKVS